MQPASPDTWTPRDNHLLVAVTQRFEQQHTPGKARLHLPSGADDWQELGQRIAAGEKVEIETDEVPIPIRQGTVLAIPRRLADDMHLSPSPWTRHIDRKATALDATGQPVKDHHGHAILKNEGYTESPVMRTCADLTQLVGIGDTIHFDHYAINDDSEVAPGVYLVPYSAVIAVILGENCIRPIGGYLLLSRVWADDIQEAELEGRMRKVRYAGSPFHYANGERLIDEIDVPPLANEGIIAWVSSPLRGTTDQLGVSQHVVFDAWHSRLETIAGVEYLCIRQDYVFAVREPNPDRLESFWPDYQAHKQLQDA